jgi:hypothetical protein
MRVRKVKGWICGQAIQTKLFRGFLKPSLQMTAPGNDTTGFLATIFEVATTHIPLII